jgi:hypothetical protein
VSYPTCDSTLLIAERAKRRDRVQQRRLAPVSDSRRVCCRRAQRATPITTCVN